MTANTFSISLAIIAIVIYIVLMLYFFHNKKDLKIMSTSATIALFVVLGSILVSNHNIQEREYNKLSAEQEVQESKTTSNSTQMQTEPEDDPNMPLFLKNLGTKKNADGTYSFSGYITSYNFSGYSKDPTIYITSTNGKEFSTGNTSLFYSVYINNAGNYGTILNDLLTSPQLLKGILFEFVYDSDGNFVDLRQ